MRVLITGGAGYIGSHTLLEILNAEYDACVFDNFSNSDPIALERVGELTNRNFDLVTADIRDDQALKNAFKDFEPEAVIHFAGQKAVGESVADPLKYYEQNVQGTISLLKAMDVAQCRKIVFSSSATVYGEPIYLPYDEKHPCSPSNPYGRTKLFIEEIIRDWAKSNTDISAVLLRYFNPVGAHLSGRIGEDPNGVPNNLMPFISQVAVGRRQELLVFGNDFDTADGTGLRDYIHVVDLAKAHVAAIEYTSKNCGVEAINVGTGRGATVLGLVKAFEAASERRIPFRFTTRRDGDVSASYSDPSKARKLLNWQAQFTLSDMCESAWKWQSSNPDGYSPGK